MDTQQLTLLFPTPPRAEYLDFPVKTDAELDGLRAAATGRSAPLARPARASDRPWGLSRNRRH